MAFSTMAGVGLLATALVGSSAWAEGTQDKDATRAFTRARQLCTADGGRLWGADLCGPILIADPSTRQVVANMDGAEASLQRDGEVFRGRLPDAVPIANTASTWNGRSWVMLMAPLPEAEPDLSILLMHEAWHRIQRQIGLPAGNADLDHLATKDGRIALRLELRALAAALSAPTPEAERLAMEDALTFRAWRQARFPEAAVTEPVMERHEGLAEYTGRVLAQDPDMTAHLVDHLRRGDAVSAYARSFAYYTGPAYGVLLDRHAPSWRMDQEGRRNPAQMLLKAIGPSARDDLSFETSGMRYGIETLRAEETSRAEGERLRLQVLRSRLVDGPILAAPVQGANFNFDPNRVTPMPPDGAVYGVIRAAAEWGVLDVAKEGLLSSGWDRLSVTAKDAELTGEGMKGDGWTLRLNPSWRVVPGERSGDWTIRPIP